MKMKKNKFIFINDDNTSDNLYINNQMKMNILYY